MGALKLKNLFSTKKKPIPQEEKARPKEKADPRLEKMQIEQFKDLISKKIQDPEIAKKAAQIISDMINERKRT